MTEIEIPVHSFIEKFKATEGALSVCESIAIYNIAKQAPEGLFAEYGTFRGKSAMSALLGLPKGVFRLYEPEFDVSIKTDDVSQTLRSFESKVHAIHYLPNYSIESISLYSDYSYVFIDSGSHQDGLPMQEVKLLEDRIVQGGIIAFHDFRSQFVEVEQAYNYLLGTGKYEEIKIYWNAIVNYVRENDLEKGNNSWHHTEMDFPCFIGAVRRK